MTDPDRLALVSQLIRHEGLRNKPYRDSLGYLTVACGYNIDARGYEPLSQTLDRPVTLQDLRLKGLTQAECLAQLDADIDECIHDLTSFPWFVDLDPVRQRVWVDLRFNLGPRKLREFKRTIGAMARKDYDLAADCLQDSLWFQQVKSRGVRLVRWLRTGSDREDLRIFENGVESIQTS
jgi:lysozyme